MQSKNDKILTIVIVVLSGAGLLYFGLSAIRSDHQKSAGNSFEYNIENYLSDGVDLVNVMEIATLPITLDRPHAIAVDQNDRILITSENHIVRLDQSGEVMESGSAFATINAIAVDSTGTVYCALEKNVQVLDSMLAPLTSWPSLYGRSYLTSIALSDADIFCADAGERIVWRFDKTGQLLNKIGEKDDSKDVPGFVIPSPYFDVVIDAEGFLWAINTGRHQFENYFADGSLRSSWQKSSMRIDGFSGCCNPVHVAPLPDGSFVTSEKGILRIKVHNQIGELVGVVALPDQFDDNTVALDIAVNSKGHILVLDSVRQQVRIFQQKDETS